jgi:hypothetical protein
MNSLIPASYNSPAAAVVNSSGSSSWIFTLVTILCVVILIVTIFYYFQDNIMDTLETTKKLLFGYTEIPNNPPPTEANAKANEDTQPSDEPHAESHSIANAVEKILPGGATEVFNISSNKYTYYDAEPLCKALGAELASYDQVKDAWAKGADWCNYGWIKGQMAVYPTSDDTYKKLQGGPEDQQLACGRPGVNGGFFDNPELRYGVNCYGKKPSQSKHDEARAASATPMSPDALEFDKKVTQFKSEAETMGILPFNSHKWD